MTLSNKLTIARILLTFVFMWFISKGLLFKISALFIFIAASFTDFLDGFFAKKRNEITEFGKFMDPIADKILVLAAFIAFVKMNLFPEWMVVIIIFRELAITGLRLFAMTKGEIIQAEAGGKHKTASQMFSIFVILIFIIFKEAGVSTFRFWNDTFECWFKQVIFFLMLVTVALTLISGFSYLVRNKRFFTNAKR